MDERYVVIPVSHELWEAAGIHVTVVTVSDKKEQRHVAYCKEQKDAEVIAGLLNQAEIGGD